MGPGRGFPGYHLLRSWSTTQGDSFEKMRKTSISKQRGPARSMRSVSTRGKEVSMGAIGLRLKEHPSIETESIKSYGKRGRE